MTTTSPTSLRQRYKRGRPPSQRNHSQHLQTCWSKHLLDHRRPARRRGVEVQHKGLTTQLMQRLAMLPGTELTSTAAPTLQPGQRHISLRCSKTPRDHRQPTPSTAQKPPCFLPTSVGTFTRRSVRFFQRQVRRGLQRTKGRDPRRNGQGGHRAPR